MFDLLVGQGPGGQGVAAPFGAARGLHVALDDAGKDDGHDEDGEAEFDEAEAARARGEGREARGEWPIAHSLKPIA